jgi:ABC-2 type transport system ATP-binding protein
MKQRASLACALVHQPRLLLLDEPTVGIDPQLRATFWAYFRRLADDGVTLIVSSHVMDEAERCDRLGFMRQGRMLAEGSAAELRAQAATATLEEAFLQFAEGSETGGR